MEKLRTKEFFSDGQASMRFIDRAAHGGCSKKGPATEVRALLSAVEKSCSGAHLEIISKNFPDSGVYPINGKTLLSTIDIVLPMTLSPSDFGKITVCHVLNDLYASGGVPLFALCILGLPSGMSAASIEAVQVMTAAVEQLSAENTSLVGGHTMTDQADFYLGFSAVGSPIGSGPFAQAESKPGDILILTKPLGTSIATLRWKLEEASESEHRDVLNGMLQSNRKAAIYLSNYTLHACTDVTGYGFLGHLFNILFASNVAAKVRASQIPCYPSLSAISHPDQSRQSWHNLEYVRPHLKLSASVSPLLEALLFDSQVSGGLLISVHPKDVSGISDDLQRAGFSSSLVGEVCDGQAGAIELIE
jgi:selenide,water dikinase